MSKDQKGFIVYGDIKPTLDELTDSQVAQLFRGMVDYFVSGKKPKFTGELKFAFIPIQQQMDRDSEKYEKRCEKNRENVKKRYERIQSNTNVYDGIRTYTNEYDSIRNLRTYTNATNTNTNKNKNKNKDKDTNTESAETDVNALSLFLIDYLNEKAGTEYVVGSSEVKRIWALLDAGYTLDQMRTVIDKKCSEWLGDEKMRGYLRPSTLFGDKFGEYLAAPIPIEMERVQDELAKKVALASELQTKKETLEVLKESLSNADKTERRALREQIAILEDSIDVIERRLA